MRAGWWRLFVALSVIAVGTPGLWAEVTLPRVLESHMVVQRNLPVHVWGTAKAAEAVTVTFRGETRTTTASEIGLWSVYLAPGSAGGPFEMKVRGSNQLTLSDVMVGDVWVAGGQSNMEFEMRKASTAAADLPKAANPRIRLLVIGHKAADYPQTDVYDDKEGIGTHWTQSTPETARNFSAVAWYFAREVEAQEKVPIGVIDSTWGGTVAEAWTSMTALGSDPGLAPVFTARGHMLEREPIALLEQALQDRQHAQGGKSAKPLPWHPLLHMWAPSMLYNGMIAPLTPLPIRGVIWYQGESNSAIERAPTYERLFRDMIEDWRRQWGVGDFPFLFVQLANFISKPIETWAPIREAQRHSLELRNTAMAVTVDVGNPDDVHPTDKATVGHRLALAARHTAYGEEVEYSGPLFRQMTAESAKTGGGEAAALRIWFEHGEGLKTQGGPLSDFEVAGEDGAFHAAAATIEGETVLLTSTEVAEPVMARYGWSNSPHCHLYNGVGLPASPFTTER